MSSEKTSSYSRHKKILHQGFANVTRGDQSKLVTRYKNVYSIHEPRRQIASLCVDDVTVELHAYDLGALDLAFVPYGRIDAITFTLCNYFEIFFCISTVEVISYLWGCLITCNKICIFLSILTAGG